ncbi:hypothetical protein CONLIGDRAFT_646373 [Coniochaeta ligniaria NRRL 30616]|uniref:Uncharacterized protein n=1 Tax=Coniochaeta ligniaria NRRL 30616 TaxID=1408157 RepID=A0A1J7IKT7_9PEZI|nr:hypothetical protein CONLIGDRAFT_646373 [Coniochaeta ligniaria NRRL 30616]
MPLVKDQGNSNLNFFQTNTKGAIKILTFNRNQLVNPDLQFDVLLSHLFFELERRIEALERDADEPIQDDVVGLRDEDVHVAAKQHCTQRSPTAVPVAPVIENGTACALALRALKLERRILELRRGILRLSNTDSALAYNERRRMNEWDVAALMRTMDIVKLGVALHLTEESCL